MPIATTKFIPAPIGRIGHAQNEQQHQRQMRKMAEPIGQQKAQQMVLKQLAVTPKKAAPEMPSGTVGMDIFGGEHLFVLDQPKMDAGNFKMSKAIATERTELTAFTVFSVDRVVHLFGQWQKQMPRVKPFYAVKCNNDRVLLATLAKLGAGFDCASREEIDLVMDNGFAQSDAIIYANTCKTPEFIRHAKERGIERFTFDCTEELVKVQREYPDAQMVLRIDVTDPSAHRPLDVKFGCHPILDAPRLLAVAKQMAMTIVGISFHVGSGCRNPHVYGQAIGIARQLFTMGQQIGHPMHVLDLGGGFPGCEEDREFFEEVSQVVCQALDEFFPTENAGAENALPLMSEPLRKISTDSGLGFDEEEPAEGDEAAGNPMDLNAQLEIIAEPGRYFASSPSCVCANVIGATRVSAQKLTKNGDDQAKDAYMYFLDDGVYGSFSCISSQLFTKVPNGKPLFTSSDNSEEFLSVVWGPTCDSRDQVEQLNMKPLLHPGDWLFYSDMGAYTKVTATKFNGFTRPKDTYYLVGQQTWDALSQMSHQTKLQE